MPETNPDSKPRRGGRRPGAGAPRGNLNALKHGRRSRQFAQLGALVAASPTFRRSLLALAARHQLKQRKADELATYIVAQVIARGLKRGSDRLAGVSGPLGLLALSRAKQSGQPLEGLTVLPPVDDRRSINQQPRNTPATEPAQPEPTQKSRADNQTADSNPGGQSDRKFETEVD